MSDATTAREIARDIRRELVCCDVYERDAGTGRAGQTHAICFWGEAAARIAESHADLAERSAGVPVPSEPPHVPDHPHTDPGDGRTECGTCGKWVYEVTHSCKSVPVTAAARQRFAESRPAQVWVCGAAHADRQCVSRNPHRSRVCGWRDAETCQDIAPLLHTDGTQCEAGSAEHREETP